MVTDEDKDKISKDLKLLQVVKEKSTPKNHLKRNQHQIDYVKRNQHQIEQLKRNQQQQHHVKRS